MEDVWNQVLAEIQLEVSKPTFITFFKGTSLLSIDDSVATISAQTHITADYIEKRYYSLIKKILDRKKGENLSLVFVSTKTREIEKKDIGPLFAKEEIKNTLAKPRGVRLDYTFENFAVSESNQLAYTAATTIALSLGTKYNPLFIYGSVGVGKTHLMHAIANRVFDNGHEIKVVCLTTEEFTNEMVEAIRDKTTTQMRKKFRNVGLLILDDIQFLSGKEGVQEELFHTFNALIDKGRQIVFSSDRPPSEIRKIESRLASRFEGGLTVDIQPPDFELRTAILLIKSKKYGIEMPLEAAKLISEKITDTRALEGFLLRLLSELSTGKAEISEQLVISLLSRTKDRPSTIKPDDIISAVCSFYNVKSTQLKGAKRDSLVVLPRHICMFLLKVEAGLTYVEIGNLLGGRDHTTVMHGVEKIRLLLSSSEKVNGEIVFIKKRVKQGFLQ